DFLVEHFPGIVDLGFTARIEEEFDEIAEGKIKWQQVMDEFYVDFVKDIDHKEQTVDRVVSPVRVVGTNPATNRVITARIGKYGPFVQEGDKEDEEKPRMASIPQDKSPDTITMEESLHLLILPRIIGADKDGKDIVTNIGRFGPYIQASGKFYSLKADDPYTVELPRALEVMKDIDEAKAKALILDFPKEKIQVLIGRYGPYIKKGRKNYKIPKDIEPKELTLEQINELIEKQDKGGKGTAKRKPAAKKSPAKKPTAKKPAAKKTVAKKAPATQKKK
ncbi:MAG: topoisomerase C-terminal repeat-containing protein, partial [Campylobacterota bacterium]|nr:topoisomerase C-terminal repeat-containing protein [Campylobacterota bacterium]